MKLFVNLSECLISGCLRLTQYRTIEYYDFFSAYLSSSILLCLLFITEAIGNPVIITNGVTGLRQQIPDQFVPSHFKDFLDVDYIFLPDLSQDFDAFDDESVPLESTGNTFFPSNEFSSQRSREEDELEENINSEQKDGLREIHSQTSSSSLQQPSNVLAKEPVTDEQSRSDFLLSSIIGGIKKDIFNNQPVNNRIVKQDRNKGSITPSREFPAALQVSESISTPIKEAAPEFHKNNFQTQPNTSRSQNLLSMIVKGIQTDIFPSNDKRFEHSAPQSVPGTQTVIQNPQFFEPARKDFAFVANPSIISEHRVLPGTLQQAPDHFNANPIVISEHRVLPGRLQQFPNNFVANPSSIISEHRVLPERLPQAPNNFVANPSSIISEHRVLPERLPQAPNNFVANPSSITSEHRVLPGRFQQAPNNFEANPSSIISEHRVLPGRFQQSPNNFIPDPRRIISEHRILSERFQNSLKKLEQVPERLEHGIQRQEHFQENRQQASNLSRNYH
ncbi:hypothetical protein Avbf_04119 [Armadillidium vulgare]|nr:hypothetical protein Avbf_04119 [Armadillidium vulgare]